MKIIRIHPDDNVVVALVPIEAGELVSYAEQSICVSENIPQGHKIAIQKIPAGAPAMKYGNPIGTALCDIPIGSHVHTHNVKTALTPGAQYSYSEIKNPLPAAQAEAFMGYRREDGKVGIRNELWIIPTVGCVNSVAEKLAQLNQELVTGSIDGLYAFTHPYGCSQLGEDHCTTRKLLAALAKHPNAGGVLILGLGCENLTMEQFKAELGVWDSNRIKFLLCQEVEDELSVGSALLKELADYAASFRRQPVGIEKLIVGLKCGGSDGLSGITANPAVGAFSDLLISAGGTTILTEVPEMFGAETLLMNRAASEAVFHRIVSMINGFKAYFTSHGQAVYENPSPGNKAGGITTLEDKSLGCVQKGGCAPVCGVLEYGDPVNTVGLNLLTGPGNDLVSATNLAASGAQMVLFTTGRGTPFGSPVPTVKISSNTDLYTRKRNWIDFDAGTVAVGEPIEAAGRRLFTHVLACASGELSANERNGYRGIAIFKDGVTL